jgi:hypothetical protein
MECPSQGAGQKIQHCAVGNTDFDLSFKKTKDPEPVKGAQLNSQTQLQNMFCKYNLQ